MLIYLETAILLDSMHSHTRKFALRTGGIRTQTRDTFGL
jgi:hypothetical protein